MSFPLRRVLSLQKQILSNIRQQVRKALGPQSKELRYYYLNYKRTFRRPYRPVNKEILLSACAQNDIILVGDYHTFAQSQKTALKLLREVYERYPRLIIALECVPSEHQKSVDHYLSGMITEKEFLEDIEYETNWGFQWAHFRSIFLFAKSNRLPIVALNLDHPKLNVRDLHAAQVLATTCKRNPKKKLFVLYGDLHLAPSHIPKHLKTALSTQGMRRQMVTIYQNSETIYWKLAERHLAHTVDVVRLSASQFCIMNSPPWVKLQSYLQWTEASELFESEDAIGNTMQEVAHDQLRHIGSALDLGPDAGIDSIEFTVESMEDLRFLNRIARSKIIRGKPYQAIRRLVLANRSLYCPELNFIYLPSHSYNALSEGVSLLLHAHLSGTKSLLWDELSHFYGAILSATLAYFGSKLLNHKRKCNMQADYQRIFDEISPVAKDTDSLFQKWLSSTILKHCHAQQEYQRTGRYRSPSMVWPRKHRLEYFLEFSRGLGSILGEKLYYAYAEGKISHKTIADFFRIPLKSHIQTKGAYFKLVQLLEKTPLAHSSKLDLL